MDKNSLILTWRTRCKNLSYRQKIALHLFRPLFGGLLLILFLKSCTSLIEHKQQPKKAPLLIREHQLIKIPKGSALRAEIKTQSIQLSKTPHVVVFPGTVEADQDNIISILPPLAGHLVRLDVTLGENVKKDQVLGVIESAGLAQVYSDKLKAQSALKQAEEALKRAKKVNHAGANSLKDIEQLQNTFEQARAEMLRTQATLKSLGTNQETQLDIRAPVDGQIIALNYVVRSYINDPTVPIFTLSNINSVWVTVCIPENSIASIAPGQKAEVFLTAYPKDVWKGTIAFVNPVIEPDTRCNKTRIALSNTDQKLKINMFTSVHIQIPQEEQILVPLSAIFMNNDSTSVYIESAPWTFKRQEVLLGSEDGTQVRIISGLKAGDRIVTAGGVLVND